MSKQANEEEIKGYYTVLGKALEVYFFPIAIT